MSSKKPRSLFFARVKDLIRFNDITVDYTRYYNKNIYYNYDKKIENFWQHKFKQQLYIEMSRVVVEDKMYMITAKDGVLSEMS